MPSPSAPPLKDTTTSNTVSTPNSMTNPTPQSCPPQSANYGGGQGANVMDWNKLSARAYIADIDVDLGNDGGGTPTAQPTPSLPGVLDEDIPTSFTALGTTSFVPPTSTSPLNSDIYFDVYRSSVIFTALSSISELSPVCLSSISQLYNSILDSGCTNHIIRDRVLFWMYHTSLAVPVKMANCSTLETLARGDIKFKVQCGLHFIVLVLQDCLHAPSAPINLSVRAMQEHCMCLHFNIDTTTIHFPSNHPILSGQSINVTVIHQLSFLQCAFLTPTPTITDGTEVAFPTFVVPDKTPSLWHHCLGHLGINTTCAILTKDYATGVDWSGPLDLS